MNLRLLALHFPMEEAHICSARLEARERLAAKVRREIGIRAIAVNDPASAAADADIVVEATRLSRPEILIPDASLKRDVLLVTYRWKSGRSTRCCRTRWSDWWSMTGSNADLWDNCTS